LQRTGPVGIETIAAALSESKDALEETIEPYLLQQGFIGRTPRGRVVTVKTFQHLGLSVPPTVTAGAQLSLFNKTTDASNE
jgi:Holliday junction DNA helicase RuvB